MTKKVLWIIAIVMAISIGLYPAIYFILDRKFGLLGTKSDELLAHVVWNAAFYTHILLGGLALLVGWIQFSTRFRNKNLKTHKNLGYVYMTSVWLSALAGIYIGYFATGGFISAAGFISLGVIWFYTTFMAYRYIKDKHVAEHQKMMIYSYAACFAAVTLRIWLPLLTIMTGDFFIAYPIVAWLCWVPNMFVANRIAKSVI